MGNTLDRRRDGIEWECVCVCVCVGVSRIVSVRITAEGLEEKQS